MSRKAPEDGLSRRERQIMDIVYQHERVTAAEVRDAMKDAPSYSAVRALLRVLEDKGHLTHEAEGTRYVYRATRDRGQASRDALGHVVKTFFEGSAVAAAAALLETNRRKVSESELDELERLIEQARKGKQ